MPTWERYRVDARYTTRRAVEAKLMRMFPTYRPSDFDIRVSNSAKLEYLGATGLLTLG